MISLNSVSPTRLYSAAVEKLAPHRLTILFGLAVLGAAFYYVYRRLYPSLHDLCKQAFEKGEYEKVLNYCEEELNRLSRINATLESPLNIAPYFWRNVVDLKEGIAFYRIISGCNNTLKCPMDDQLKAQFLLQKMEAYLGLNQPAEAIQTFEKNKDLLIKQSKLLALTHYLLGVAYQRIGTSSSVVESCDKALEQIPGTDLELNVKILALKSLALLDMGKDKEAFDVANSASELHYKNQGKVTQETLVVIGHALALSSYGKKEHRWASMYFEESLKNIEENDQYLRNLLTFQDRYCRAAFAETYTVAQTALREAEAAFKEVSECKSDDRRPRSELLRCVMQPIIENYLPKGKSLLSQLARRIELLPRATSST